MSDLDDSITVFGHHNPDTDASAGACGYARFLSDAGRYDQPVVAAVPGKLTRQAAHVFERAGATPPAIIQSLAPIVDQIATSNVEVLSVNDRFRDAVEKLIRSGKSMLPIVEEDGTLHGTFTNRNDVSRFLLNFDVVSLLGNFLGWDDIASMRGGVPLGREPEDFEITGQLHVALEGDPAWMEHVTREDLLVCGTPGTTRKIPRERVPAWVVIVSESESIDPHEVAELNDLGATVMQYQLPLHHFLSSLMPLIKLGSLNLGTGPCVGKHDLVEDVRSIIQGSRHALPVLEADGTLVGTISHSDLKDPPKKKVVLVDHFESGQTVQGMEHAEILEIVDHHRIGDLETSSPVRVDCRPVGSSSTIVALNYREANLPIARSTAVLLLGGLLADTLCLKGPTTSETDVEIAAWLGEQSGLEVESFGLEVLRVGDDLLTSKPAEIWNRDQKLFGIRNQRFAVAQLETVSLVDLPAELLGEFRSLLEADFARNGLLLSLLVLTDVLTGNSWVSACESESVLNTVTGCFGEEEVQPHWTLAPGIVSRKKQVIPSLMTALAEADF